MEDQSKLLKGELMEEKLRLYFLNSGYYVARGVKYNFKGNEITDIDLFLYGRISSLSRERINVDIKNKKSSKAFERILWAKGLQNLLHFNSCVVATTDRRDLIREYGKNNNVIILDGTFLQKLEFDTAERISEDELLATLVNIKSYRVFPNQTWKQIYEDSKSRLLSEMDFSGFNANLISLRFFLNNCFDQQKKDIALRCSYILLSHSLLILDYIQKDIAFLDHPLRKETLNDGFKFGNLGREGVNRTIDMAIKIANSTISANSIKRSLESNETDILKEFFSRSEVSRKLFSWAIEFEKLTFQRELIPPLQLEPNLRGLLSVFLDYFGLNRKDFFNLINIVSPNESANTKGTENG